MPNTPLSSRTAMTDQRWLTAHSICTTSGFVLVTLVTYVKVMLGVICCSRVIRAWGLNSTPVREGSMRSLVTPKKRWRRPETGLATASASRLEAPGGCAACRLVASGLEYDKSVVAGELPVASSETIGLKGMGGSDRGVRASLLSGPAMFRMTSTPRALVYRSTLTSGSMRTGL